MRSRLDKRAAPVQRSLRAVDIDRPHATHSQAARKICRPTTQSLWAWFITSTRARAARLIHKTAKSPNSTNQGHALSIQGSQLLVLVPEALLQVSHLRLELLDLSVGDDWASRQSRFFALLLQLFHLPCKSKISLILRFS